MQRCMTTRETPNSSLSCVRDIQTLLYISYFEFEYRKRRTIMGYKNQA
jgi:hypothetical protein